MPSLRGGSIRDMPEVYPERNDLFQLMLGPKGLNPSNEADKAQLQAIADGYLKGAYDDAQIEDFISKNPATGVFLAPVIQKAKTNRQYFDPGRPAVTPFEGEFAGKGALLPQDAIAPKADIQGAYLAAMRSGDVETANKILSATKDKGAEGKNINSYALALRAEGLKTDDDRVNRLTPEQASNALARTMPPVSAPTPGGTVFMPRGGIPGQGGVPAFVPNPKDLSTQELKDLADVTGASETSRRLLAGFQENYGGYKSAIVGDAVNEFTKRFGGDTSMADWWQDYQSQKNIARNKLFGGALTDTERKEWEKADINPGMTPKQIRTNLARQTEIKQRAAAKITRAYKTGSYNQKQVDAVSAPATETKTIDFSQLPKRK